ncbi:hypothetical protein C8F04DRAFT_1248156 [Mycena alexandri]|uniref:Transmembrane protein n=1 Tax=Mycena alexandri TaxID=1745969 RepID=A0AAD6TIV7_9AGAR|nr:hypothetical protein C8F04DRAFT_1248156 [Mycena alexandri]
MLFSRFERPLHELHPLAHVWNPDLRYVATEDSGFFAKSLLLIVCFGITLASSYWSRSPRSGHLKREENQPPRPPPPLQLPVNQDATDDEDGANRNDGDGDDEPQQDEGMDEQNEPGEDGHATVAAPAPEDPPPPGGLAEEDNDDRGNFYIDGGLQWLALLLVGAALLSIAKRSWRESSNSKHVNVKTRSATIPELLERQMALYDTVPNPALPTVAPATTSITSVAHNTGRVFAWRNVYLLLAVLSGLGFLVSTIRLLLPLRANNRDGERLVALQPALVGEHVAEGEGDEQDDLGHELAPPTTPRRHRTPRTPPPSPATCQNMLAGLSSATALRMARVNANTKREEERKERVREVQHRLWGLMYELRAERVYPRLFFTVFTSHWNTRADTMCTVAPNIPWLLDLGLCRENQYLNDFEVRAGTEESNRGNIGSTALIK